MPHRPCPPCPCPCPAEYRLIAKKGEGTFSEVLKAQCIKNGKYVAIKCMKNHFDSIDQVGGWESSWASLLGIACMHAAACMHITVKCMKNRFDSIDQVGGAQIEGQAAALMRCSCGAWQPELAASSQGDDCALLWRPSGG